MVEKIQTTVGQNAFLIRAILLTLVGGAGGLDAASTLDGLEPIVTENLPECIRKNPLLMVLVAGALGHFLAKSNTVPKKK